jgi:hypothetical protein
VVRQGSRLSVDIEVPGPHQGAGRAPALPSNQETAVDRDSDFRLRQIYEVGQRYGDLAAHRDLGVKVGPARCEVEARSSSRKTSIARSNHCSSHGPRTEYSFRPGAPKRSNSFPVTPRLHYRRPGARKSSNSATPLRRSSTESISSDVALYSYPDTDRGRRARTKRPRESRSRPLHGVPKLPRKRRWGRRPRAACRRADRTEPSRTTDCRSSACRSRESSWVGARSARSPCSTHWQVPLWR